MLRVKHGNGLLVLCCQPQAIGNGLRLACALETWAELLRKLHDELTKECE